MVPTDDDVDDDDGNDDDENGNRCKSVIFKTESPNFYIVLYGASI